MPQINRSEVVSQVANVALARATAKNPAQPADNFAGILQRQMQPPTAATKPLTANAPTRDKPSASASVPTTPDSRPAEASSAPSDGSVSAGPQATAAIAEPERTHAERTVDSQVQAAQPGAQEMAQLASFGVLQAMLQQLLPVQQAALPLEAKADAAAELPSATQGSALPMAANELPAAATAATGGENIAVDLPLLPPDRATEPHADKPSFAAELKQVTGVGGLEQRDNPPVALANVPAAIEQRQPTTALQNENVHIEPTVGQANWGEAVGQKLLLLVGQKQQNVEMQLNPPHLGPMEVKLDLSTDQANISFITAHPAVREALLQTVPKLEAMLADNGIMLGQVQVDLANGGQTGQRQHEPQAALARSGNRDDAAAPKTPVSGGALIRHEMLQPGRLSLFA